MGVGGAGVRPTPEKHTKNINTTKHKHNYTKKLNKKHTHTNKKMTPAPPAPI